MKIVVIGGTGLIGTKVAGQLRQKGHEAVPAAPRTGVNTITSEGFDKALSGAEIVVDVTNSPSFEDSAVLQGRGRHPRPLFRRRAGRSLSHAGRRPPARLRALREMVGPLCSRRALSFAINATNLTTPDHAMDTFMSKHVFRQPMTDLLAMRLLVAQAGSPVTSQPVTGGLSPTVLRRAIERLRSDGDADVSLAALASDAGLSRCHFCRAFKESTGLSPHGWRRQYQLQQAMNMLRATDDSIESISVELGYSSQTAFAAAFRKLTGETPSNWRRCSR